MADMGLLILRVAVGVVMVLHGVIKFRRTAVFDARWLEYGLPQGSVALTGLLQVVCGLAMAGGIATRLAALMLVPVMLVATYVSIAKHREGFLSGATGKGWDINFLLTGALLALIFLGGGRWALTGW